MTLTMHERSRAWPEGSDSIGSFVKAQRPLGGGAIMGAAQPEAPATDLPAGLSNEADRLGPDYYKG